MLQYKIETAVRQTFFSITYSASYEAIHEADLHFGGILYVPTFVLAATLLLLNGGVSRYLYNGTLQLPITAAQLDPYECGFEPYGVTNSRFILFFYVVGILFIIFDLELIYIIPGFLDLGPLPSRFATSAPTFGLFLSILVGGFLYEWRYGVLDIVYTDSRTA